MIPGQNLLKMALTVIAKQTVTYYKYASRSLNDVGQDVTVYEPPVQIKGSLQPIERKMYEKFGLDMQNDYVIFYVPQDILDIERDVSGDQIEYNGNRYQCQSDTEWFSQDGWDAILCVKIRKVA